MLKHRFTMLNHHSPWWTTVVHRFRFFRGRHGSPSQGVASPGAAVLSQARRGRLPAWGHGGSKRPRARGPKGSNLQTQRDHMKSMSYPMESVLRQMVRNSNAKEMGCKPVVEHKRRSQQVTWGTRSKSDDIANEVRGMSSTINRWLVGSRQRTRVYTNQRSFSNNSQ